MLDSPDSLLATKASTWWTVTSTCGDIRRDVSTTGLTRDKMNFGRGKTTLTTRFAMRTIMRRAQNSRLVPNRREGSPVAD